MTKAAAGISSHAAAIDRRSASARTVAAMAKIVSLAMAMLRSCRLSEAYSCVQRARRAGYSTKAVWGTSALWPMTHVLALPIVLVQNNKRIDTTQIRRPDQRRHRAVGGAGNSGGAIAPRRPAAHGAKPGSDLKGEPRDRGGGLPTAPRARTGE